MVTDLTPEEQERLSQMTFELETSVIPVRMHALRLMLLLDLYKAVRECRKLPPRAHRALQRIPKLNDRLAWDRLSAEEKREAGIDQLELEIAK